MLKTVELQFAAAQEETDYVDAAKRCQQQGNPARVFHLLRRRNKRALLVIILNGRITHRCRDFDDLFVGGSEPAQNLRQNNYDGGDDRNTPPGKDRLVEADQSNL